MKPLSGGIRDSELETAANTKRIIITSGALLLLLFLSLTYISKYFSYETQLADKPVPLLVMILVLSGAVYIFVARKALKSDQKGLILVFILFTGLGLRLSMFFSTPMLEDDYFRYMWDGAVTAHGYNPCKYSPQEVVKNPHVPEELSRLKSSSGDVISRINHPSIRSMYPPITQAFFALSYLIKPWSLTSWRAILLVFDMCTLLLILYSLELSSLPLVYSLIYWWNPLLVKEIYNSGHFDVLVLPFALGGMILAYRSRYLSSVLSLAAGIGVKLWPAFLIPLVMRSLFRYPKRFLRAIIILIIILSCLFLPLYLSGPDRSSGMIAYGRSWENNDSIFRMLIFLSEYSLDILGFKTYQKYYVARVAAASLAVIWIVFLTLRKPSDTEFFKKSLYIIAFIFLISPTEFPWYYTWLLPFLCLQPRISLLLLTALLPFYYLRYYLEPRGELDIFTNVVVWFEFVPVWVLLFLEWRRRRRRGFIESPAL
jgi:alpha-1,6-mannosyltransferase